MNSGYHPSDMSQSMPLPSTAGYAPAPVHPYQQQHHHQHHQQAPLHPPPPHHQQHQHQHQQQRQQPHPLGHQQQPPPPHQLSHLPPPPNPSSLSHHSRHQQTSAPSQPPRVYDAAPPIPAEDPARSQEMMAPLSKVDEATGRKYYLDVVQQPQRARMCGFGDKDRRPITPPPCVRLVITDISTGKEVDCNDVDHSMFVLNVDLWSEDGQREVNLVRSSGGNPAISSTTPFSYSTLNGGDSSSYPPQQVMQSSRDPPYNPAAPPSAPYVQDYQLQSSYSPVTPSYTTNGSYGPPQQYFPQHQGYRSDQGVPALPSQSNMSAISRNGNPATFGTGMFTRNLIGSLAASAFRLQDCKDRIGIWFVLQDLSVRTEGTFRLRFSFVNVGPRSGAPRDPDAPKVNTGRAPILASCFSESFMVYSAKKFPGVCESTPLSKTFAGQGIKIPIRKDGSGKGGDNDDDVD